MDKEYASIDLKTIFIVVGIIIIAAILLVKIRDIGVGSDSVTGATAATADSGSNIRSSAPTPTSCTKTQNCGSPTCGTARGGACGAASGGSCGG